jgi:DDE domain
MTCSFRLTEPKYRSSVIEAPQHSGGVIEDFAVSVHHIFLALAIVAFLFRTTRRVHWGLRRLRREDRRWMNVLVRNSQYLNNIVEQDHRAIKGRCRPMLGFKSYRTAAVTLAGIELAHRIRKRQFKFGLGRWICWSLKKQWDRALA